MFYRFVSCGAGLICVFAADKDNSTFRFFGLKIALQTLGQTCASQQGLQSLSVLQHTFWFTCYNNKTLIIARVAALCV